jgi:pimeloyl-ACP methyl ester carboxylesterase
MPGPRHSGATTIAFSHANGFPAGTYRLMFDAWRAAGFEVTAVERYGHAPAYPVTSNWPRLRDQLIDHVEQHAPGRRVHFVGHSLGGFLSLKAACKRPDLAASVVLLDSPVIGGWRAHSVHALKLGGMFKRMSPGRVSVRRRWQWPSAEAAWQHFAGKTAFARWAPEVLRDYIASGMEPDPGGTGPDAVRLAFHRDVETHIYNTLVHDMPTVLHRHPPKCPVSFIGGTRSAEVRQCGLAATKALVRERISWVEGTHLFPMERPGEAARALLSALTQASPDTTRLLNSGDGAPSAVLPSPRR